MPNFELLIADFSTMPRNDREDVLRKLFNTDKGIRFQNSNRSATEDFKKTLTIKDRSFVSGLYRATDTTLSVTARRRRYRAAQLAHRRPPLPLDEWESTWEDDQANKQGKGCKAKKPAAQNENIETELEQYLAERDDIIAEEASSSDKAMSEWHLSEDSD